MKKIDVEIWKRIVDSDSDVVYAESLCCDLGMTRRQLISRVAGLDQSIIKKAGTAKDTHFIIDGGMKERIDATIDVLSSFFKCDRARVMSVADCVSIAGYMTLDEISVITNVPTREVAYILYVMPNIVMQKGTKKNHYTRMFESVSVDMGTADHCTQLAQ